MCYSVASECRGRLCAVDEAHQAEGRRRGEPHFEATLQPSIAHHDEPHQHVRVGDGGGKEPEGSGEDAALETCLWERGNTPGCMYV